MKNNKTKLENYIVEKAKKKNGGELFDERQMQSNGTLFAACITAAIIFDVVMMTVYFFRHNMEKCYPYLAQLVIIIAVFAIVSLGNKEPGLPRTLSGRAVSPDKSGKALAKRLFSCFVDSFVTAAFVTALNIYVDGVDKRGIVSDTAIFFAIFMLIEVTVCEVRVYRWRKHQEKLDAEENNLED